MRKTAVLLVALTACSSGSGPSASPSATITSTPTTSTPTTSRPTPSTPGPSEPSRAPDADPIPAFSASRAMRTVEALVAIGPREASGRAYGRAADAVAGLFEERGYRVRRQTFAVPAGSVDGTPAREGRSENVIAEPPGFDATLPHVVVGAHLDTVPDSPGANDNASGVAAVVELARLSALAPPDLPAVFVAFGAEERRRTGQGTSVLTVGASVYVRRMGAGRARALQGMINLDMIGNGPEVLVLGSDGSLVAEALAAARREGVPARPRASARGFSDHGAFIDAGYDAVWLWAGDHPSLHTPGDDRTVVRSGALRRAGRVAWALIRALRPV